MGRFSGSASAKHWKPDQYCAQSRFQSLDHRPAATCLIKNGPCGSVCCFIAPFTAEGKVTRRTSTVSTNYQFWSETSRPNPWFELNAANSPASSHMPCRFRLSPEAPCWNDGPLCWNPTAVQVQRCIPSAETLRTNRDGKPRTATSTFTQLFNSDPELPKGFLSDL